MTFIALIPARAGSKGIPGKNIKEFFGKPLLQWSIELALKSPKIQRVIVSTDDHQIADIARNNGAEVPFMRPSKFSCDDSPGIDPVLHALDMMDDVTDVLYMQPTSPLRSLDDLESIIELRSINGRESAVSMTLSNKHPAWMYKLSTDKRLEPIMESKSASRRQELDPVYVLNGAFYLASRNFLLREKKLFSSESIAYIMPPDRSIDIDSSMDWLLGEFLMSQQQQGTL